MIQITRCEFCGISIKEPNTHCSVHTAIFSRRASVCSPTHGICRFCGHKIKRLKNGKNLRWHYSNQADRTICQGSRKLDFAHKGLLKISEGFDNI